MPEPVFASPSTSLPASPGKMDAYAETLNKSLLVFSPKGKASKESGKKKIRKVLIEDTY